MRASPNLPGLELGERLLAREAVTVVAGSAVVWVMVMLAPDVPSVWASPSAIVRAAATKWNRNWIAAFGLALFLTTPMRLSNPSDTHVLLEGQVPMTGPVDDCFKRLNTCCLNWRGPPASGTDIDLGVGHR